MNFIFSRKVIVLTIALVVLIGAGVLGYAYLKPGQANSDSNYLSAQEVSDNVLTFINKNILRGQGTASLVETTDENGIYKIKFNVNNQDVTWGVTKDGKLVFPQTIDLTQAQDLVEETGKAVGNFSVSAAEICKENEKPIVYFFGSESCSHCQWEKPIIKSVMAKFKDLISFHENIDTETDSDVFQKYSTGGIPTLVFGCKYYRVGSGEGAGEDQEVKDLTALACKLTGGEPGSVCDPLKDIVNGIQ